MNRQIWPLFFFRFHLVEGLPRQVFLRFCVYSSDEFSFLVAVLYVQATDQSLIILEYWVVVELGAVHQVVATYVTRKTVMIFSVTLKNLVNRNLVELLWLNMKLPQSREESHYNYP